MAGLVAFKRCLVTKFEEAFHEAMGYRGREKEVWIINDSRHGYLNVCVPRESGTIKRPPVVEIMEFNREGAVCFEPYFRICFGKNVVPELKE